jgi:hypothetical protein
MVLGCTIPRLEAAIADGPLAAAFDQVFAPGWFCCNCPSCVFPDLVRDFDDES